MGVIRLIGLAVLLQTGLAHARTPQKFIFTGGPGVGKTTLIDGLRARGYLAVPEAARHVIQREQGKSPRLRPVLPWTDLVGFQHKVLRQQSRWENSAAIAGRTVALDRSFVDPIAYLLQSGQGPRQQPALYRKIFGKIRRAGYTKVFFLDQLPRYVNDPQRKESVREARQIHDQLFKVYTQMGKRFGFDVVRVPAIGVDQRLDFVLRQMQ